MPCLFKTHNKPFFPFPIRLFSLYIFGLFPSRTATGLQDVGGPQLPLCSVASPPLLQDLRHGAVGGPQGWPLDQRQGYGGLIHRGIQGTQAHVATDLGSRAIMCGRSSVTSD